MTKINEEGVIFFTINKRDGRIFSRWMEKNSKSKIRISSFISEKSSMLVNSLTLG